MMKKVPIVLILTVLATGLAGCATNTPEARIEKHPQLFESFPPDVQAMVKEGKVEVGYTQDMAFIALGPPDHEYTRTTQAGTTLVWSYVASYTSPDRQRVEGSFQVKDSNGQYRTVNDWIWVDVKREHEYERLRIEFNGDIITAIEQINERPY